EQRRRQRIDDRLAGAVAQREQEHAPIQTLVGRVVPKAVEEWSRGERHDGGQEMKHEGNGHQRTVADTVREKAEKDNRQAKPGQAAAGDRAQFPLRKAELCAPISKDTTAD